jgi:hypothetical protein
MTRRPKRREAAELTGIARVYEGPELVSALLERAGSALSAPEVAERFRAAIAAGEDRSDAIPALFEAEPRFASPDEARRLYGNLFALWDRLAAGKDVGVDVPAADPEAAVAPGEPPPLPPRGAAARGELTPELVEAVWKHLSALPERERQRLEDRFENAQPDLAAWLDAAALPEAVAVAARDLAFEAWAMFDVAFGDRLGAPAFKDLRAVEAEPPPLEASQPALGAYATEALDLAQDDDPSFSAAERAQVERVIAAVAAALGSAVSLDEE